MTPNAQLLTDVHRDCQAHKLCLSAFYEYIDQIYADSKISEFFLLFSVKTNCIKIPENSDRLPEDGERRS